MSTIVDGHYRGLSMAKKRRMRRHRDDDEKGEIVAQTRVPGFSVSRVARRYDVNANLVFKWLLDPRFCPADNANEDFAFLPVEVVQEPNTAIVERHDAASQIEIQLSNGHRLSISGTFDPDAIGRHVLNGDAIFTDDTLVKMLAPGSGKTKTARLRAYTNPR